MKTMHSNIMESWAMLLSHCSLCNKLLLVGLWGIFLPVACFGQTNNYFGSSGLLSGNVWSTNVGGPYSSPLVTAGGAILIFNNPGTATGATVAGAAAMNFGSSLLWTAGGAIGSAGTNLVIDVTPGIVQDFGVGQNFSTSASAAITKTGQGVLAMMGDTYSGGFTLNGGTILLRSVNAMGTGVLNLNSGIIAANTSRNLSGKYTGITIGGIGNIQFGDVTGLANASANLVFDNAIALNAPAPVFTMGNAGTTSLGGVITGMTGLTFTSTPTGSGLFDITNPANTFTGTVHLNGGKSRFAADGSFGNAANVISIDGGQLVTSNSFTIAATHSIQIGNSAGTGFNIAAGMLSVASVIADKSSPGSLTKYGPGMLELTAANTYTGQTEVVAGTLRLNRASGNCLPGSNNIVVNGGTLRISTSQTLNGLSLVSGNLIIDDGATLTIDGSFEYFQQGSITLSGAGTGKIAYGAIATLKYSGNLPKLVTSTEFPLNNPPYTVICNNAAGVGLPIHGTVRGSLILNTGTFTIQPGGVLELNNASLVTSGGALAGSPTGDLVINGALGGTVSLPGNIQLQNILVEGSRTLTLNGINPLNLYGTLTVGTNAVFDNGGESQLINAGGSPGVVVRGTFINRDKDHFTGTAGAIPGILTTLEAGSTINYGLATGGSQVVTGRTDYSNIIISGTGTKIPSNAFNPVGTLKITGAATFDCTTHNVGDFNTNLTMDGGRLIVGTGGTQPAMSGLYQLSGGVIEFAGNTSKTIRTQHYQNIEVSGTNVGNSLGNITLHPLGTFTVKNGGIFTINDNNITGPLGTQTVTVEDGGTFNCGNNRGFNGFTPTLFDNSSLHPDIENIVLMPGSTVNYLRDNDQAITNANGLIYQHLMISGSMGNKTAPAGALVVQGNLTKTGNCSFAHNNGHLLFNNAIASSSFSNLGSLPFACYDFTNSNTSATGLQLQHGLEVANSFNLTANSTLNLSNGDVTLLSTASNTARVAPVPPTASINYNGSGRFMVQRYYPGNRSWRLVTSPLSAHNTAGTIYSQWQNNGVYTPGVGAFITGPNPDAIVNGLDNSNFNNYSLKTYKNSAYVNIGNTRVPLSGSTLDTANMGYFIFVRGDRSRSPDNTIFPNSNNTTLSSRGKLQVGTQAFAGITMGSVQPNFTLVGNPYPSPVDFNKLVLNNLVKRFTIWDPLINQVGGFVLVDDSDNDGNYDVVPASPALQGTHIQSGQAFFIEAAGIGPSGITFNESSKSSVNNQGVFRAAKPGNAPAHFRSALYQLNAGESTRLVDGNLIKIDEAFDDAIDQQDALKFSNINETFGLYRDGRMLVLEKRSCIRAGDTLQFKLTGTVPRNYQLSFEFAMPDPAMMAMLEDKFTGTRKMLYPDSSNVYNFTVSDTTSSAAADRFRILFQLSHEAPLPITFIGVTANLKENHIMVSWTVESEISLVECVVERSKDGIAFEDVHHVLAAPSGAMRSKFTWLDKTVSNDTRFYRVRAADKNGEIKYSRIVTVKQHGVLPGIGINHSQGDRNSVRVQFNDQPGGFYEARIFNFGGQLILRSQFLHAGGSAIKQLSFNKTVMSGAYVLEVQDTNKTSHRFKLIIP